MPLPCWDESDNGIPDLCLESEACPFNPDNKWTNDNFVCQVFGNIGFPYFDARRRVFMGVAMWSTLSAIFVTAFGALSLSTEPSVVRASYWLLLRATNATDGARTDYYVGLRSIVTVRDEKVSSDRLDQSYYVGTIKGSDGLDEVQRGVLEACADSAAGNQIGALLSCVTLIFALLGTINRMKFASDANVQKALGLVTDTWGAATLSATLLSFHVECFAEIPSKFRGSDLDYRWGPAWVCYLFCCLSGLIRAVAHWVTPTPGNGAGACTFSLPQKILRLLDGDGDGQITWADQKAMYLHLKAAMAEETHAVNAFVRASVARFHTVVAGARHHVDDVLRRHFDDNEKRDAPAGIDPRALRVAVSIAKIKIKVKNRKLLMAMGETTEEEDDEDDDDAPPPPRLAPAVRAASQSSLFGGLIDDGLLDAPHDRRPSPVKVQPAFADDLERGATRPAEGVRS